MNPSEEAKIKAVIQDKITTLTRENITLNEMTQPQGLDSAIGRVSRMDYINNKSIEILLL